MLKRQDLGGGCLKPARSWRALLLISAAGLLLSPGSLTTAAPVKIAARLDLPPYVNAQATSGIEIDLVKAIFTEADLEPAFVQVESRRMAAFFRAKRVDGILTQFAGPAPVGCATGLYFEHHNVGFSLKNRQVALSHLEDLSALSVLSFRMARHYLGDKFKAIVSENSRYLEHPFQSEHIELLYERRFEVVIGDEWIIRLGQKNHFERTGEIQAIKVHHILDPLQYAMNFHQQMLCDQINEALATIRQNGTYQSILDRYHKAILSFGDKKPD